MKKQLGNAPLMILTYALCALILLPIMLVIVVSFTTTPYLTFPPEGVTIDWYLAAITNDRLLKALSLSVQVGLLTAVLATILGIIGGLFLSKSRNWVTRPITAIFLAPLTIPMIVLALGMLFFFTRLGFLRTMAALVIGHTVIAFPYSIRMISASVGRDLDQLERAASVLGAKRWQVFYRVTFPTIRAGVVAGMMFAFLISFNNVTIALFISGARTQTLPVLIFQLTKEQVSPELAALASLLIVITYGIMILLEKRFGIYRILEQRRAI